MLNEWEVPHTVDVVKCWQRTHSHHVYSTAGIAFTLNQVLGDVKSMTSSKSCFTDSQYRDSTARPPELNAWSRLLQAVGSHHLRSLRFLLYRWTCPMGWLRGLNGLVLQVLRLISCLEPSQHQHQGLPAIPAICTHSPLYYSFSPKTLKF